MTRRRRLKKNTPTCCCPWALLLPNMPPYDPRTRKEGNGGVAVGVTPPSSAPKVFLLAPLSLQIGALEAPCRRAGVTPLPPGWSAQFGKSGVAQLSTGWALAGPTGGISAQRKPSNCAKLEGPGCVEWSNCMVPISISTLTSRFCAGQKRRGVLTQTGPFAQKVDITLRTAASFHDFAYFLMPRTALAVDMSGSASRVESLESVGYINSSK